MKIKRLVFLIVGYICLALGCLGIVLPILPTVPFFLVTAFCFARSSQKLHNWFVGTNIYKNHLESFIKHRGMTVKSKAAIISSVTLIMGASFILMSNVLIGRIAISIVWICHLIYFVFGAKTIRNGITKESESLPEQSPEFQQE